MDNLNKEDIDFLKQKIENVEKNIQELREICRVSAGLFKKLNNKIEVHKETIQNPPHYYKPYSWFFLS